MPNLIKIEVSEDIATKIRAMAEQGIFTIDTGSAEVHFKDGNLLKIITHRTSYPLSSQDIHTLIPETNRVIVIE